MQQQYTPGPWDYSTQPVESYGYYVQSGNLEFIGEVGGGDMAASTIKANAQLIAAAPDLLEALQELCDIVEGIEQGEYTIDSFTLDPARQAIRKALGEQADTFTGTENFV